MIGIDICKSTINHNNYSHIKTDILSEKLPEIEGIEVLINNAGVQNTGRDIDINLKGSICCSTNKTLTN